MLLRCLGFGVLFAVAAFLIAAFASYFLILEFSSNVHDRSLEAAMSSAFFYGPIGAFLGLVGGAIWGARRVPKPPQ
jgi:hypothetical protein